MADQPIQPPEQEDFIVGRIVDHAIERELADSYLTYAMSTIVDRALPDVRDGLKPSQRRILVAMNDLNLSPGRKHSKCAGIVGETMKKYHPHGDGAIYPTLVNLAQEWKTRALLIDKQGNFGSVDPDPPAAMRYTEARLHHHAMELLSDLKLDTVDWQPNFDEVYLEPKVLPAKFPNLLVNGSTGIAVGMACSMAPHNLGEVCDAIIGMVENPDITISEIMQIMPGPDFPSGGIICGRSGIVSAYTTGRGRLSLRAKIHHEQTKTGRNLLVVTELPYQVSKNDSVIAKIVDCRKNDRITDISNVIDESSNRRGMRLVIELKKAADPSVVENQLYQLTPLQSTFSIINIALVKGQPLTLGVRELLSHFIDHRVVVIRRRTAFRLREALREAHRIEGLIYAVCDIDAIIKLIRSSRTRDEAIEKLMTRGYRIPSDHPHASRIPDRLLKMSAENDIHLSRMQAESIGRMQLIQLVGLEIEKLTTEYSKLLVHIEEYEDILANMSRVYEILKTETLELKNKYADERRTKIAEAASDLNIADLITEEQVVVTITHGGYVKRLPVENYKTQGRGGRGVIGADTKEGDFTEKVFVASTHDDLLCFTNTGRVFKIKVFEIPESSRTSRGRNLVNLIELKDGERICEYLPIADFERDEAFLMFATANGTVKRTVLKDYRNVNRSGLIAINLKENDHLIGVTWTSGDDHILLGTDSGIAIRFHEEQARAMGRNASGVRGIKLNPGVKVVNLIKTSVDDTNLLLTMTENGYGKRTPLSDYLVKSEDGSVRAQSRGGKGRKDLNVTEKNGKVVRILRIEPHDQLMMISNKGMIVKIQADTIRQTSRGSLGVKIINLQAGDTLASAARVPGEDIIDEQVTEGEIVIDDIDIAED